MPTTMAMAITCATMFVSVDAGTNCADVVFTVAFDMSKHFYERRDRRGYTENCAGTASDKSGWYTSHAMTPTASSIHIMLPLGAHG